MVLYKTEGSFCLLVHDDIATSSAWHAKGSGSNFFLARTANPRTGPDVLIIGRRGVLGVKGSKRGVQYKAVSLPHHPTEFFPCANREPREPLRCHARA